MVSSHVKPWNLDVFFSCRKGKDLSMQSFDLGKSGNPAKWLGSWVVGWRRRWWFRAMILGGAFPDPCGTRTFTDPWFWLIFVGNVSKYARWKSSPGVCYMSLFGGWTKLKNHPKRGEYIVELTSTWFLWCSRRTFIANSSQNGELYKSLCNEILLLQTWFLMDLSKMVDPVEIQIFYKIFNIFCG